MNRRPYTKLRRAEAEAATRERIVRAAVDLHAKHGATATSYGMIAEKAKVSPQTVYNHFPELGGLIEGCTGHVQQRAPAVDAACFAGERTAAQRLRKLTAAVYAQLEFVAPWMRLGWGEAERVPALRAVFERNEAALRDLIAQAVAPEFRAGPAFLDAALLLLDYPAWKRLTERRSRVRAAALAGDGLVALLEALCQASPKARS